MAMIMRAPYVARRRGSLVFVAASPIRNLGRPGKGPKVIPVRKTGALTRFGYSATAPASRRHRALKAAMKRGRESPLSVFRRLQAIATLSKRTMPLYSKVYLKNRNWVRSKFFRV